MSRFGLRGFLIALAVFLGLTLTPDPAFAQHGGGGHGGGGGGGSHGGGGGGSVHGGGGSHSSARSYGGERGYEGGGSRGGSAAGHYGMGSGSYRGAGAGAGRNSFDSHSANIRPAINDGQWHSFGSASGVAGGTFRGTPGFGRGYGWGGGYGWGRGWGCCGSWGWGGWGFGFGWPYWGWGLAWNPWWYNPYWYAPWPASYYYPYYGYDWSDNPPPYRPDSASDDDSNASYPGTPGTDDGNFNLDPGARLSNSDSVQNGQTPQPETAPNRPAPAVQPQVQLISQPQT